MLSLSRALRVSTVYPSSNTKGAKKISNFLERNFSKIPWLGPIASGQDRLS